MALADLKGAVGADGDTPVKGVDYWTETDKGEIIQAVVDVMGGAIIGYVDENNVIVLVGGLEEETYTVKYQMEDESLIDIGELDLVVKHSVTNNLTNCTNSNDSTEVDTGDSYTATITAGEGYNLSSLIVTMGGVDITSSVVSGGTIGISSATGDIVITAVATVAGPAYTNLLPLATDASGNPFVGAHADGGDGYEYGYRVSRSTGEYTAAAAVYCTGFIPATLSDVIRLKNITMYTADASRNNIVFYNSSKVYAGGVNLTDGNTAVSISGDTYTITPANNILYPIAYFRMCCGGITDDTIITVNQPIV